MYFPIGWPKQLGVNNQAQDVVYVTANRDRFLFAVLGDSTISIWYCKPAVQIVLSRRSENSVQQFGTNIYAVWKPDTSLIAVTTAKGYILFYQVDVDVNIPNAALFVQKEERRWAGRREGLVVGEGDHVPALKLSQGGYMQIAGGIKCMVCLRDELMVSTGLGMLRRIRWDGCVIGDMDIALTSIPFSLDLQHSRASQLSGKNLCVSQIQYSSMMGGFAVVLSNGKAAFITANTLKFEPSQVVGVLAQDVNQATCTAVNHKYTLMAFGCENGQGVVYNLDELTGALQVSHRLIVSSKDFPDAGNMCGSVVELSWTPDGCALALAWEKGGFSLWSSFGALLLFALGSQTSLCDDVISHPALHIKSMEWGSEGYHLWMISNGSGKSMLKSNSINRIEEETGGLSSLSDVDISSPARRSSTQLLQFQFVKSALTVDPCTTNHEHLFLQGEDRLYLSTEDSTPAWITGFNKKSEHLPLLGNKQWQIVPIPHSYLAYNWPIRFAAVSGAGQCVAVAGKTGLAHYALFTRKWKVFGNESQERDMVVTGGLTWWKDFICTACYNLVDQRDEIRFYPRDCKLDNNFAHVVRVPSQIMLLNTFHDILIVLCADCHIMIFRLERNAAQATPTISVIKQQEVAIGNFIPHPATVVALTMTSFRTETASIKQKPQPYEAESIIVNVGGRLLMFQRDRSGLQLKSKDIKDRPLPFCAPVMIASSVENMWSSSHHTTSKPHLTEALWLGCGAAGLKVWLPLHLKEDNVRKKGFMSTRIMLPFFVDIYPLAILFEAGIIFGANSESLSYNPSSSTGDGWPYMQLERSSQVYLHHILRQLLRRNLGVHALEVARSCKDLPYFSHILELLLHEVLEEEATSKEPIPDPLLPRVVAFIQEFPQYLQTVVHCARKTEVALWQYLFSTVGNPKDLFEECLLSKQLDTAASYLIILQNLEKPIVSRQHATLLLDASLQNSHWNLARDLVRFLKAIDPSDVESPNSVGKSRIPSTPIYPGSFPTTTPPLSPVQDDYPHLRSRSISLRDDDNVKMVQAKIKPKEKPKLTRSDSQPVRQRNPSRSEKDDGTAEQFFIDSILQRHARKLLSDFRIRDLACFAANLEDYQLVSWLRRERLRAAKVENFVEALKKLHTDFTWPLPIITLKRMASANSLQSSTSSYSFLEADLNNGAIPSPDLTSMVLSNPRGVKMAMKPSVSTPDGIVQMLASDVQLHVPDDASLATEASENSLALEDPGDSSETSDTMCMSDLQHITQELANKGPEKSELELRYLYQIVLEAGCLEWALIIAILLRDGMAVVRTVNTACLTETPLETVARMREGLSFLDLWADTECFGYQAFLKAIQAQTHQLTKIVEQNLTTSKMTLPSRTTSISSSDGATTEVEPSSQTGASDLTAALVIDTETANSVSADEQSSECAIS